MPKSWGKTKSDQPYVKSRPNPLTGIKISKQEENALIKSGFRKNRFGLFYKGQLVNPANVEAVTRATPEQLGFIKSKTGVLHDADYWNRIWANRFPESNRQFREFAPLGTRV